MTVDDLVKRFPVLFHMAEPESWPSIERHGLLSTQSLLELFEITGERRDSILSRRRSEAVVIEHPLHGRAVIRDQKPLSESKLAGCLRDGLSPAEWIRLLNSRVFFWVDPSRLEDLKAARAYRAKRQLVLQVRCESLLEVYGPVILLSDRNTGTTSPFAHARGRDTFRSMAEHGKRRVVELTVDGQVLDIGRFLIRADEVGGGDPDCRVA